MACYGDSIVPSPLRYRMPRGGEAAAAAAAAAVVVVVVTGTLREKSANGKPLPDYSMSQHF
jgi:hypothetical protein